MVDLTRDANGQVIPEGAGPCQAVALSLFVVLRRMLGSVG
jgi:hypothetical protein